jgi:hypothetical protein
MSDRTALSYWFPRIAAADLPVPRTKIVEITSAALEDIFAAFDGKDGPDGSIGLKRFAQTIRREASEFGAPFFLRTDHTSAKHSWKRSCFVGDPEKVESHIIAIVEYCECASIIGLPYERWAIREFLPIQPLTVCPSYGDMPVCREFRVFVDGPKVLCHHPYWPREALIRGGANESVYENLCREDDIGRVLSLASRAGEACGGAWSVDVLETARGLFVTDMAEAHKSFHWEGCEVTFPPARDTAEGR